MTDKTKAEFEALFRSEYMPGIWRSEASCQGGWQWADEVMRSEEWNNTVDAMVQSRELPERASNWTHPRWLETLRPVGVLFIDSQ